MSYPPRSTKYNRLVEAQTDSVINLNWRSGTEHSFSFTYLQTTTMAPSSPQVEAKSLASVPDPKPITIACPHCGQNLGSGPINSNSELISEAFPLDAVPVVIPPGPLVAENEPRMSPLEELRLLKCQIADIPRICVAVSRGDLSQKLTVQVQGVFMTQVKGVINDMVRFPQYPPSNSYSDGKRLGIG